MNKKTKLILIIVFFITILGAGYYFLFFQTDNTGNTIADNTFGWKFPITKFPIAGLNSNQIAYSNIRDPGGIPQGLPIRLKIPVIGVDSTIEDAVITPDGRMDVPSGSVNVAWFALGPHPGEIGSAVIGGHFGIKNGVKFVFYDLDKIQVGDKIYIVDDIDNTLAFQVRLIKLFDQNADATTVFTSNDGLAHLNLITCEGIWNKVNNNYPSRRVVFADAIEGEGAVTVKVPTTVFSRSLHVGIRGSDVKALQKLVDAIPVDGIFGTKTKTKVQIWQTQNGLVADGFFGPISRAKFISIQSLVAVKTTLPSTAIEPSKSNYSSKFHIFVESLKSLYATPAERLITSILFIAIIFVVVKIILLL